MLDVIVVAANAKGEIVRYFEAGETASFFGSPFARSTPPDTTTPARGRMIASTGKVLAASASPTPAATGPTRSSSTAARRRAAGSTPATRAAASAERPARDRRLCLLAECAAGMARGAAGPGAHRPADRPLRLQPPPAARRRGDAAVRRRRARADRRLAARCTRWRPWCWLPDRAGPSPGAAADAGQGLRLHEPGSRGCGRQRDAREHSAEPDDRGAGRPLLKALLQAPLCYRHGGRSTAR